MSEAPNHLSGCEDPGRLRTSSTSVFNPVDSPNCARTPQKLDAVSPWIGHLPFAMYLVAVVKPRILVELGTHQGTSYCAFCQAVKELRLPTRCYAVGTWTGDPQAGFYSQDVLNRLREYHDLRYSLFSRLLQAKFDDALPLIEDGSIDVLHIDGYHIYEAVKHDYDTWRAKMSDRGVILFQDTEVRDQETFGVWRFWDEIKQSYPHFEFFHSHGLGVLAVGKNVPEALLPLLNQPPSDANRTRQFFENLGERVGELRTAQIEKHNLKEELDRNVRELKVAQRQRRNILHAAQLQKENLTELLQVKTEEAAQLKRQTEELARQVMLQTEELARQVAALQERFQYRRFRMADKLVRGCRDMPFAFPALCFLGNNLARLHRAAKPLRATILMRRALRLWRHEGIASMLKKSSDKLLSVVANRLRRVKTTMWRNRSATLNHQVQSATTIEAVDGGPRRLEQAAGAVDFLRRDKSDHLANNLSISVIVPNYNHAPYLKERLRSLFVQTRTPNEIIVLDDASTDDSVTVIRGLMAESPAPIRVVVNEQNSGSTFRQWFKGIGLTSGDLIWIAESDDACAPEFLERVVPEFSDPDVVLAYSQSTVIDSRGQAQCDYLFHTNDLSPERWRSRYKTAGSEEIRQALLQKNTIPNASAVVLRRSSIPLDIVDELTQFKFAGDWFFYAMVLRAGKIAFVPEVLNKHRRHDATVMNRFEKDDLYPQETLKVKARLAETFKVSADAIARSWGVSASEYYLRGQQLGGTRPSFSAHPRLASERARLRAAYEDRAGCVRQEAMRILIIAHDLEIGGGQLVPIRLANHLAKTHRVLLCNARPWRVNAEMLKQIDPSVRLLEGTLGMAPWGNHGLKHRVEVLRELVRFHEVDVISSHIFWADKLAYEINRELGLPWFVHLHGCYEDLAAHPQWEPDFLPLVSPIMASASGVFYGSDRNLTIFDTGLAPMPKQLIQVFNGLDPAGINMQSDGSVIRSASEVIFVLVARPIPEKGWEEAIRATLWINALPSQERAGRSARLILIGGGPNADDMRRRYGQEPALDFRGQVLPATRINVQCDVGILPSRFISESVPLAVIEYLACGLPVIATEIGSIAQMIQHNGLQAGTIVPLRADGGLDIEPFARAMLAYVKDDSLWREHQANARAVFNGHFHMDHIAAVCETVYLGSLGAKNRPDTIRLGTEFGREQATAHRRLAS